MTGQELWPKVAAGIFAAMIGSGIGWGASALTLAGRVDAIEHSQKRLEQGQDRLKELMLQLVAQGASRDPDK